MPGKIDLSPEALAPKNALAPKKALLSHFKKPMETAYRLGGTVVDASRAVSMLQPILTMSTDAVASEMWQKIFSNTTVGKVAPLFIIAAGGYRYYKALELTPWASKHYGKWFSAEVIIEANAEINRNVMKYVMEKGYGQGVRSLRVIDKQRGRRSDVSHDEGSGYKSIEFQPAYADDFKFKWNGHNMTLKRDKPQAKVAAKDKDDDAIDINTPTDLKITCYKWRGQPMQHLKDFLQSVHTAEDPGENTTAICTAEVEKGFAYWRDPTHKATRPIGSVALEKSLKDELVQDIESFISQAGQDWFARVGIPYRRGYLFYGPPGTGKTSMVLALAGKFKLKACILSMSDPNLADDTLKQLFGSAGEHDIILLEDIDCSSLSRNKHRKADPAAMDQDDDDDNGKAKPVQAGLTLSGLLNVLDGVDSPEGRIVIMSANDPDSLDKALIRNGRVDKRILFGYASHEVCAALFKHIYSTTPEEIAAGRIDPYADLDLTALGEEYASLVPGNIITPAEVSGHLMVNRFSPTKAVAEAKKHFETIAETKRSGKNVAAFANEISKSDKDALNANKPSSTSAVVIEDEEEVVTTTVAVRSSVVDMDGVTFNEHAISGASQRKRSSRLSVALSPIGNLPPRKKSSNLAITAARVGSGHSDGVRVSKQSQVSRQEKAWLSIVMN